MWKVKEEVNLRELEKFGFDDCSTRYYRYYRDNDYIWVDKYNRIIDFRYHWAGILNESIEPETAISKTIITKLTKAGLVEKVIKVVDKYGFIKYIKSDCFKEVEKVVENE